MSNKPVFKLDKGDTCLGCAFKIGDNCYATSEPNKRPVVMFSCGDTNYFQKRCRAYNGVESPFYLNILNQSANKLIRDNELKSLSKYK
ncbi:hypothetical protein VPAG_00039 [Vibrio phage douglas 12A4]|uniref:hypothetical protein n=1 Tax=Vibrio phage douglas 12A4 TaxID=573171 RepID=UPI0002C13497|nr:hypothetical protein VPAG_00039 [Vibrio phage douglas 12A4]AGG58075.1 hypothetical protein VPAG_00039 [Vibrio phage douglas 12A4]